MSKVRFGTSMLLAVALVALALPASAQDIEAGIDLWQTRGDGSTYAKFDTEPLPADFFCSGSAPFAGKIVFKGKPIATEPAGVFRTADTILERLDHASFDENGVAVTRLQMRAMQFEGVELLTNECGSFQVELALNGEQPITEMRIYRPKALALRSDKAPVGRFAAEIGVNTLIRFIPVGHTGPVLEVTRDALFPPLANSLWSTRPGERGLAYRGFAKVDTDSDGIADTFLPGTSRNFAAGWAGEVTQTEHARMNRPQVPVPTEAGPGMLNRLAQLEREVDEFGCHPDACGVHCPDPVLFDDGGAATQ